MNEASKAARRRKTDWRFTCRWFVGRGLDVGCGSDPLRLEDWPKVVEVVPYDKELGHVDGQFLPEIADEEFDFVHSSHCLEHMPNPRGALANWLRVLKPGGFIICSVPEELLYEAAKWPSRFNSDHRSSFTLRSMPLIPMSINVLSMLWKLPVDVEHVSLLTEAWDPTKFGQDQTLGEAESAIEFVVRRQHPTKPW